MEGTLRAVNRRSHSTGSSARRPAIAMFVIVGLFACAALVITASVANAATVRLPAADDSYVNSFDADDIFGAREYIVLGEYHATHPEPPGPEPTPRLPSRFSEPCVCETNAYLKFLIPRSVVPDGSTILSARLKLCAALQPAGRNTRVTLHHQLADQWNEDYLSWNNRPTQCSQVEDCATRPVAGTPWCTWNVLDLANETVETDRVLSLVLRSTGSPIAFLSQEAGHDQPYLEIEFLAPTFPVDEPLIIPRRKFMNPIGYVFAINGVHPNPSVNGRFSLAFSLPDASPVRIEVLDLGGRRVAVESLKLGAGRHVVPLEEGAALAPGVYVVRLTQGARSVTAKAAVVR